ncbi:hypothetical protein BJV78DRAFT_796247 [Lactifluus subvellereus]|nr:hypothetical protein BJV78DRAFT_796247 [Lactifluus subvellereus]
MVRRGRVSRAFVHAAGCLPSNHAMNLRSTSSIHLKNKVSILRNVTGKGKARADVRKSKKHAMVKPKLKSCWLNAGDDGTISIPVSQLLNELPVRVREEVEVPKACCTGSLRIVNGDPRFDTPNLRKHQLFSNDHAKNLDPEIAQWLPRIVCPACTLNSRCQGGSQRRGAMLRHVKACKGFQSHFPDERGELFPCTSNQTPSLDADYRVLKMTSGQLEFLRTQLTQERKTGKRKLAKMTVDKVQGILHSWHPIGGPGVEEVPSSDFPPVRIPRYLTATTSDSKAELEYDGSDYDGDLYLNSPIFVSAPPVIMEDTQDLPELAYPYPEPELYLPPHLLPPTIEPTYLAAATAAHAPAIGAPSPLFDDFLSFPQAEAEVHHLGDPLSIPRLGLTLSPERDANSLPQGLHSMLQDTFSQSVALFNQLFIGA